MRPALALLLATALALAVLGGCGGGGGSSTPAEAPSSATTPTATATPQREGREAGGESGRGASPGRSRRPKPEPGGEKSIEDYGSEAAGSGREALLSAFHGYLEALGAGDYATACSHLSSTVQRSLKQFAAPQLRRKGCPAILPKLLAPTAAAIARQQAAGRVTKVRVRGSRAFVVYHAPGAKLYMLTMVREGGEWKAALVAGSVLVPSPATLGR